MNPVQTLQSYLSKIHFNIILPHIGLPSVCLQSGFISKPLYAFDLSFMHAERTTHLILLNFSP